MTFFRVARDAAVPVPVLRPGVEDVSAFLVAHAVKLRERAEEGSTANASFADAADAARLEAVRSGDDDAFLTAAAELGARLIDEMRPVGPAAPGLLLCTTVTDDQSGDAYAVVLKLEVVSEQGAVLKVLDTGEETLAAVKDVLDQPGKLQKGVVFPDDRPGSKAVVGDLSATQEARYFLRAVGATLEMRAAGSAAAVVRAVAARSGPAVAQQVAAVLPTLSEAPLPEVLTSVREAVPDLTEEDAGQVQAALVDGDRPVVQACPDLPLYGRRRIDPGLRSLAPRTPSARSPGLRTRRAGGR
jgi:hypothetical protein